MAGKAPKAWALPRFWVSIGSYEKQLIKKIWGRVLGPEDLIVFAGFLVNEVNFALFKLFKEL